MARRKSSHRRHRAKHTRAKRSRRVKHNRRRHTRRVRRTRRGGDGSIGTPYPAARMMPLRPEQTLDGRHFSRANQIGGGLINPNDPTSGGIGRHTGGNGGGVGRSYTGGGGGLINPNDPTSGGIGRHTGGNGGLIGGNPAGGGVGATRQSGGGVGHSYTGRSQCEGGILQPSGSMMKVGGADGYMKTCLNTGGRG